MKSTQKMKLLKLYGQKKLLLAFEYGAVLSDVAKKMNVELTPEMINRAEDIVKKEFTSKNPERLAIEMMPNILAVFEPN